MKFALLKPWNGDPQGVWMHWQPEMMNLTNIRGGGFPINENASYWSTAEIRDFSSWGDLYAHTKFNPLAVDVYACDVWISPDGEYFDGDAHQVQAEYICELVYDVKFDNILNGGEAEDYLVAHGWIKATRGFMWRYYLQQDVAAWKMTTDTHYALQKYCNMHSLKMPSKIEIIDKGTAMRGNIYGENNLGLLGKGGS